MHTPDHAAIRRTKSSGVLQTAGAGLDNPILVRDTHGTLCTIQYLQPMQKLLLLTPLGFCDDLFAAFKAALLLNYPKAPKLFHRSYGTAELNETAEALMSIMTKTVILINNVDSHQVALIERTTDKQPLLILIGCPSSLYLALVEDARLSASLLTLLRASVGGLQDTAALIRSTAMLRMEEESLDGCSGELEKKLSVPTGFSTSVDSHGEVLPC